MPNDPFWITEEVVIGHNRASVEETGENFALLFPDKLTACIMRPQNLFYYENQEDIVALSVNLMVAIAQAHPFEQGNKRAGFMSGVSFLYDNGYDFKLPNKVEVAVTFMDVVTGKSPPHVFEDFMAAHIEPSS